MVDIGGVNEKRKSDPASTLSYISGQCGQACMMLQYAMENCLKSENFKYKCCSIGSSWEMYMPGIVQGDWMGQGYPTYLPNLYQNVVRVDCKDGSSSTYDVLYGYHAQIFW